MRSTATFPAQFPDFRKMRGEKDLHLYLGCAEDIAAALVREPDANLYEVHQIPKRRGGTREVWEVRDPFADTYKALSRCFQAFFVSVIPEYPHRSSHGYLHGRSILTNATEHIGATRILRADIRSFFRSIAKTRVREFLLSLGIQPSATEALLAVVVRDDHLPLGLHTSPTLANAICHELDGRLACLVPSGHYTRYADDLTFSGPELPTIESVGGVLADFGFALALDKCGILRAGRGLYVTGLSIEDRHKPRVPKAMKRRIRQELYYASTLGLEPHIGRRYASLQSGINHIHGTIQFIRGIERTLGDGMHDEWTKLLRKSGLEASYGSLGPRPERKVVLVIDESVVDGPTGKVMALALVAVEDSELVGARLSSFLSDRLAAPYPSTSPATLETRGLHWNELTVDDRTRAVDLIGCLPFRAFVAFSNLSAEDRDSYTAVYRQLLRRLMQRRLVRYDQATVTVVAEENNKVLGGTLNDVVANDYADLAQSGSRKPHQCPKCQISEKMGIEVLPLADLVLGVFAEFARVQMQCKLPSRGRTAPGAQAIKRFGQVRDKIRAIFDLDTGKVYSRRQPFEPWQA